jgi:hypothetical protein
MGEVPPLTGVVLYAPEEVQKHEELIADEGWWISAALKESKPGDRIVVYQTQADQGITGVFDVATDAFWGGELRWAAYGRPTDFDEPIMRTDLRKDPVLSSLTNMQGRRRLRAEEAERLAEILPSVPQARSSDPLPEAGDPDWHWEPMDRWWGSEIVASDALASHEDAWSFLGFAAAPHRERSPRKSRHRTDLKGVDLDGFGRIAEVKHFVALSTLDQLDRYLVEAREDGQLWYGDLIALTAYTTSVANAVRARADVRLWLCERDEDGLPDPAEIA